MVQMNSTFNNPTPHGGPPFHKWKNGFGFGKRSGPGDYVMDPSIPCYGRYTPGGEKFYQSNAFWRKKTEVGQAAAFGIGDRPEYGNMQAGWSVAPNNYGDVSKQENSVRRNVHRSHITVKKRFPSMDEKYRERQDGKSGPGPARYDIRLPAGNASLTHPSKMPKWSMQCRTKDNVTVLEELRKPGPAEYAEHLKPGFNSPIQHGTLYDIAMKGRNTKVALQQGPGPGQYNLKGFSDRFNIMPDYVPSFHRSGAHTSKSSKSADVSDSDFEDGATQFGMKRAESAPGSLRVKGQ